MAGAAIFGLASTRLLPAERAFLREADPWGVILFSRNVENPEQTAALVSEVKATLGRSPAVLVDQEGGRVARFRPPWWRKWEPPAAVAPRERSREAAEQAFRARYGAIARELAAVGVNVNCVPSLDLPRGPGGAIGDRALSCTPGEAAAYGRAVCEATLSEGVLPVVKHVPGHGAVGEDSHEALPVCRKPLSELESWDMRPFRELADMPVAMTAHVRYDALDDRWPATQSKRVVGDAVRGRIGFNGLLLTDDLCMKALTGSFAERARAALAAGCDIALHCSGTLAEMREMMDGVPTLAGAAARRAEAADRLRGAG